MTAYRPWWGSPYYRGKAMPKEKLGVSPLSSLAQGHLFHASGERASSLHPANGTNPGPETAGQSKGCKHWVWQVRVGGDLQCSSGNLSLSESGC